MINIEEQYFKLGRNLLLAIGLWPYQRSIFVRLQYLIIFGILTTAIIFHFTIFLTEYTAHLVIEIISSACMFVTLIVKHTAFWLNGDTVKFILEELQRTCDEINDKNELTIIEKYGKISKRYANIITMLVFCSVLIFILVQSGPSILDVILPKNKSRPRRLLFPMEYLVDHQKYFHLIQLHLIIITFVGGVVMVATGILLFVCQEFVCGMFRIASYRINRALRSDLLENASQKNKNLMFKEIIKAVDIHRKAISFSELLQSRFEVTIATLVVTAVVGLSLNLFRIFQIISSELIGEDLFKHVSIFIIIISYMFIVTYIGQTLTDHNSQIFITAYNVQWYRAPLHVQSLILFLLQKGNKEFTLTVGGLLTGSLQSFATLANTSMSYFTVMYATQK